MRDPNPHTSFLTRARTSRAVLSLPVLAILLSSAVLRAQARPATPAGATPTDLSMDVSQNCPVELSARRWGMGGAVENVRKGQPNAYASTLLLHFGAGFSVHGVGGGGFGSGTFSTAPRSTVVSATVIVQGFGYVPHDPSGGLGASTRTQTLHLTDAAQEGKGNWRLDPDQVPFASQIDIAEMRFRDGTTWKEARGAHCYVAVSGFTLVIAGAR